MSLLSHSIPLKFATIVKASAERFIDLDAQSLAAMRSGQRLYVESVKRWFEWDPTSTATNDNTTGGTCLQATATVGAGRAIWDGEVSPSWWSQNQAWVVDTTATTYEGLGTLADPLPTNAELMRRTNTANHQSGAPAVSITWNTTTATSDPWTCKFIVGPGSVFSLLGKKLTTITGATTAATAVNRTPGAQAMPTITNASATWVVGQHGTFTSGTASGAFFVVLKDLTGGVARISTPLTFNQSTQQGTRQVAGAVSNYELYTIPQVTVGTVEFYCADTAATTSYVVTDLIEFRQPQVFTARSNFFLKGIRVSSQRTTFASYNAEADNHTMCSCFHTGGPVFNWRLGSKCIGGGMTGNATIASGGQPLFDFDFCFQGVPLTVSQGVFPQFGTCAFFDAAGGLTLSPGAVGFCLNVGDGAGTVWGTTTSGFGMNVKAGAQFCYNVAGNKPVINSGLGAGRESQQGGVDVQWAAVPVVMNVNNAAGIFINA
jgi:hypothetical protein